MNIKLEALRLAVAVFGSREVVAADVVETARVFEAYLSEPAASDGEVPPFVERRYGLWPIGSVGDDGESGHVS